MNKIVGAVKYDRHYKKYASGPNYRPKSKQLALNLGLGVAGLATLPVGGGVLGAMGMGGLFGAAAYGINCGSQCRWAGAAQAAGTGAAFGLAGGVFSQLLGKGSAPGLGRAAGIRPRTQRVYSGADIPGEYNLLNKGSAQSKDAPKEVASDAELRALFDKWSYGGSEVTSPRLASKYPGSQTMELPDGSTVTWRTGSGSGGPTVQLKMQTAGGLFKGKIHLPR